VVRVEVSKVGVQVETQVEVQVGWGVMQVCHWVAQVVLQVGWVVVEVCLLGVVVVVVVFGVWVVWGEVLVVVQVGEQEPVSRWTVCYKKCC
jgi:hypothetical protein